MHKDEREGLEDNEGRGSKRVTLYLGPVVNEDNFFIKGKYNECTYKMLFVPDWNKSRQDFLTYEREFGNWLVLV